MTAISVYSPPKSEPINIELPRVITQYDSPGEIEIPNYESPVYMRSIYSLALNTPPNRPQKLIPPLRKTKMNDTENEYAHQVKYSETDRGRTATDSGKEIADYSKEQTDKAQV